MRQLKMIVAVWMMFCLLSGSGCSLKSPDKLAGPGGREVIDSQGFKLTVPHKPQRIVSLSIASDEILMELVAVSQIAALTYTSDDVGISNITEEAKQVKGKVRANAEAVIGLNPDLVLFPDWQPLDLVQVLRDAGLPVYVFKSARSIAQVRQNITEISQLVGESEKGAVLISRMDHSLAEVSAQVQSLPETERQVAARFSNMGGSGGIGSTFDDICRQAGVRNAAAIAGLDTNGSLSKEQLVQINPDFLLLPTWDYTGKKDLNQYKQEVQDDPALQTVRAVQQKRLIQIPDRYLFCTSQHIVKGVRSVAQAAYPQLFRQE
ncbi:MAG TPA: ABC transporter substrate-binding protein [Patescibacteria group bacterium]|nr:ABC transporter substrate-binding protein [Patescibacteria group bacterium]